MNVDFSQIENLLVSEIKLSPIQARIFLLVVTHGRMNAENIAKQLEISTDEASDNSKKLMELGGFIDMPDNEFEAMHPRFTAVNMYRKMCEREQIEFKKNLKVDNIGVVLEKPYDDARAKYNNKK
jgi:predicted transcriptional regulator